MVKDCKYIHVKSKNKCRVEETLPWPRLETDLFERKSFRVEDMGRQMSQLVTIICNSSIVSGLGMGIQPRS